jgi:hypothetical protein
MIIFGLILTFLLGVSIVLSLSRQLKVVEITGLSFPLGIAIQTLLMVCLDWAGIRLTAGSVTIASLAVLVLFVTYLCFRRIELQTWVKEYLRWQNPKLNWGWLICICGLVAVVIMNIAKTMYFPTFDTDSVRGFDLIGMAVGREGTIRNVSIFTDVNFLPIQKSAGSYMTYTPFTQLAYAYVYMFGTATSKIIPALMFISFVFAFYGVLSRFATHLISAIVTLLMIITPEMLAFSSMSGTNYNHAVFASLGIIYFIVWYYKKIPSALWISASLLMANNWVRSEGIAFIGAACVILLFWCIRQKQYGKLFIFGALCVFPFLFWNIFLRFNHLESENVFIFKLFYDDAKLSDMKREIWELFKSTTFYGITFILFLIILISNVISIFKRKDHAVTLLLILLSWIFYNILFYQIDYVWDSLLNVLRYSYKRFLFSFVPLLWFYIAVNFNVKWLSERIDRWIFR